MKVEEKLAQMGLSLPSPSPPVGNYIGAVTEDFTEQPKVINGASDLLIELYGEAGRHARSKGIAFWVE